MTLLDTPLPDMPAGAPLDPSPAGDSPPVAAPATGDLPPKRGPGRPKGTTKKAAAKPAPTKKADSLPRPVGRPSWSAELERKLGEQLAGVGALLALVQPADGLAVVAHAESVAAALTKLAQENPKVRKLLEGSMTGSAWLGVLIAVGGLGLQIAANHGALGPVGNLVAGAGAATGATSAPVDLSALADALGTDGGS